jgi:hypothetical protein
VNPSTAEPEHLDNTLKSVQRIAGGNGYDSFIMFNVYAQRATSPDDMDVCLNTALHRENMRAFEYVLSGVGEGVRPRSGPPGAPSSKSGTTCRGACGHGGAGRKIRRPLAAGGACSKRASPSSRCICRKDEKTVPFDVNGYLDSLERK